MTFVLVYTLHYQKFNPLTANVWHARHDADVTCSGTKSLKTCVWKRRKFSTKWYTTFCIYRKPIVINCVSKLEVKQTKNELFGKGFGT